MVHELSRNLPPDTRALGIALRALVLAILLMMFSMTLHASIFSGRVVEGRSGDAIASAEIKVFRTGERGLAAELATDGAGDFQADLPDGKYELRIFGDNYVATDVPVQV